MVGEYGAKMEVQPREERVRSSNVQEVESTVERWYQELYESINGISLVLDHGHFASAVNLFSYLIEQISL